MAVELIEMHGEIAVKRCDTLFDRDSVLYAQKVWVCKKMEYASIATNKKAAIATLTGIQASLAAAARIGWLECDRRYPCD